MDGFAVTWLTLTFGAGLLVAGRLLVSAFVTCAPLVTAFKGLVGCPEVGFDSGAAIARFGGCADENEPSRCFFKVGAASEVRGPDAGATVEPIAFDVELIGAWAGLVSGSFCFVMLVTWSSTFCDRALILSSPLLRSFRSTLSNLTFSSSG